MLDFCDSQSYELTAATEMETIVYINSLEKRGSKTSFKTLMLQKDKTECTVDE